MTDELKQAIDKINSLLPELDAEERLEVFSMVGDGYCSHCGYKIPDFCFGCHCMNDE